MSRPTKLNAEEFIETWQKADSPEEVAKAAGATAAAVGQRASLYRHKGIPLKYFPRQGGGVSLDIDALTKLAKAKCPKDAKTVRTSAAKKAKRKVANKRVKRAKKVKAESSAAE